MAYDDQVIQFSVDKIVTWVGSLDTKPHKMGPGWFRILNPCQVVAKDNRLGLSAIQGNGDFYKKYVDIRVPDDAVVEIRTLDKGGELHDAYLKEIERKKSTIIKSPGLMSIN